MQFPFTFDYAYIWKIWERLVSGFSTRFLAAIRHLLYRGGSQPPTRSDALVKLPAATFPGSTALFFRLEPGVILKAAAKMGGDQVLCQRDNVQHHFDIERRILERLGEHPRIVRLLGNRAEFLAGLLFAEASHGNLQSFIHQHNSSMTSHLRQKWFVQAIESIAFIHSKGVIHSDLRPENFLVDRTSSVSLDLRLCDFGGSTCHELQLDGGKLADSGFYDPKASLEPSYAADLFSLGSVLYTIMTNRWPFRTTTGQFSSAEEMEEYETYVDLQFASGIFPVVRDLFGGDIILDCWTNRFSHVSEVMARVQDLMSEN